MAFGRSRSLHGRAFVSGRNGDSLTSPVIRASGAGTEELFTEDREDRKGKNEIELGQDRIYMIIRMKRVVEETHPVHPVNPV